MSSDNPNANHPSVPIEATPNHLGIHFSAVDLGIREMAHIRQLSPAFFAYLGDAVYELFIRTHYLLPPKRLATYHEQVVSQVRAETQATYLQKLIPYLTDTEKDVVRRGRNAANNGPRRVSTHLYQQATSLETLIGYLYLHDPQRLNQLLKILTETSI